MSYYLFFLVFFEREYIYISFLLKVVVCICLENWTLGWLIGFVPWYRDAEIQLGQDFRK
jgi:hypothetical protein